MEMLRRLGVDAVGVIHKELGLLDSGIAHHKYWWSDRKKAVFYHHSEKGWILRCEYIFDKGDPSSPFMAEFFAMTADADDGDVCEWPFDYIDWKLPTLEERFKEGLKWESCYDRREARKARKELIRSGQKRRRDVMPGAWVS